MWMEEKNICLESEMEWYAILFVILKRNLSGSSITLYIFILFIKKHSLKPSGDLDNSYIIFDNS